MQLKNLLVENPEGFLRIIFVAVPHKAKVTVVSGMRVNHDSHLKYFPDVREQGNQLILKPVLGDPADAEFRAYRVPALPARRWSTIPSLSC